MHIEKLAIHGKKEQESSHSTLFVKKEKKASKRAIKIEVKDEAILYRFVTDPIQGSHFLSLYFSELKQEKEIIRDI